MGDLIQATPFGGNASVPKRSRMNNFIDIKAPPKRPRPSVQFDLGPASMLTKGLKSAIVPDRQSFHLNASNMDPSRSPMGMNSPLGMNSPIGLGAPKKKLSPTKMNLQRH